VSLLTRPHETVFGSLRRIAEGRGGLQTLNRRYLSSEKWLGSNSRRVHSGSTMGWKNTGMLTAETITMKRILILLAAFSSAFAQQGNPRRLRLAPRPGNAIITGLSHPRRGGTTAKTPSSRLHISRHHRQGPCSSAGVVKLLNVMKFATFARKTQSFSGAAARIAKRRGLDLAFTFRGLGRCLSRVRRFVDPCQVRSGAGNQARRSEGRISPCPRQS